MSTKKRAGCPREHPRLFKTGTIKKGKNSNYIIVESASGAKRWKRQLDYTDIFKTLPLNAWYEIPDFKLNNWDKWMENLTDDQKKSINKIRNSYDILEDLGICVIECINLISKFGFYWGDYPWDYATLLHPDIRTSGKSYIIANIRLDKDLHLDMEYTNVYMQHQNIDICVFSKFIEMYNKTPYGSVSWSNSDDDAICFKF